ncbi:MAG: ribonuclease J, partial [Chloroflexi bacterium]|nr:ribonuclease J [Chloroflexota bacterium]
GYLDAPPGIFMAPDELRRLPPEQVTIIATGSQGEPTSVLARIGSRDHRQIRIIPGDTVVLSSTPIPGNEVLVSRTIDNLFRQGARVLYSAVAQVHVHGHASQEELKLMLSLLRPRYFVPVHGEYRHLVLHSQLAAAVGVPPEQSFVLVDGDVLEIDAEGARMDGKVPSNYVYVDGVRVGHISNVVLRDRRVLSRDGILLVVLAVDKQTGHVIGRPDVVARGVADPGEIEGLLERTRDAILKAIDHGGDGMVEWGFVTAKIKETVARLVYEETKRRPLILPVPVEV